MQRFQFTNLTANDAILLLKGLGITVGVWSVTMLLGTALGFVLALAKHRKIPVLWHAIVVYTETFRNSPLLVQLFLVFYGLPMLLGFGLNPIMAGIATLTVNTSAFVTVIVFAALNAVPQGQWEAAAASGLGYRQSLRFVILPQAVRTMIPPTITLAVGQLQVSSLVGFVGVVDLTKIGSILNTRTLAPFLIWPIIAALYFAISKPLSLLAEAAERRLQLKSSWTSQRA